MHRSQLDTLVFALAAAVVTVLSAVLAYQGVVAGFERSAAGRLERFATFTAAQLSGGDLAEVARRDSSAYLALEVQLEPLVGSFELRDLAVLDAQGRTLFDRGDSLAVLRTLSPFDTLAHDDLRAAAAGTMRLARPFRFRGGDVRAAFVPIRDGAQVAGILAVVIAPDWNAELARVQHRLALIGAVSLLAIAVLAGLLMRLAGRQVALERRLSRSENLAAMGRLSATLAHEIKNPLAIIRGSAKRLGKLEPEAQRMADSVVEEVDRLTRTVARYLAFARGDERSDGTGDAAAALVATLDLLEGEFHARRCTLVRAWGNDAPAAARVALEDESLKQVYLNLVLNALEAVPEGGRVTIGVAAEAKGITVTIDDDGPGFAPEVLPKLGEPFMTTKAQGTGLGLFHSRRMLQGAGGSLAFTNPPGGGARVTLRLPLRG